MSCYNMVNMIRHAQCEAEHSTVHGFTGNAVYMHRNVLVGNTKTKVGPKSQLVGVCKRVCQGLAAVDDLLDP